MTNQNYDFDRARAAFEDRINFTTGTHELDVLIKSGKDAKSYQVVDVRFPDDYAAGHVPGAINLPMPKWQNQRYLDEHLDREATLYLYCYNATCHLAAQAALKLLDAGYKVVEVEGGWQDWLDKGQEVEKEGQLKSA
jgi:rhodanese-related sulfurtransferase